MARLRAVDLIRGGSLDNAIVLTRDGIMNGELRFPDEFGRHKTLDLIGDLALIGRPLLARVVAHKAGHALHTQLVSRLLADPSLWIETSAHVPQSDSREPEEETYVSQEYSRRVASGALGLLNGPTVTLHRRRTEPSLGPPIRTHPYH